MSDPTATSNLATSLATASVSDALDPLGLPGSLHGIGALRQGPARGHSSATLSAAPRTARPENRSVFILSASG